MAKRRGPDDETADIPIKARIINETLGRLDKMGIGVLIILIAATFIGATGVWGANHIGDPAVKSWIQNEKSLTASQIEKDHALVEVIKLSVVNAEANQKQVRDVVQLLVDTMRQKHDDDLKMQSLLTELRDEIRNNRNGGRP